MRLLLNYFADHADSNRDIVEVLEEPFHEVVDQLDQVGDVMSDAFLDLFNHVQLNFSGVTIFVYLRK